MTSSVTTGLNGRIVLDQVRDRQYAADGGVEFAIAQVRALPLPGPAATACAPGTDPHYSSELNDIKIRIDCADQLGAAATTTGGLFLQRNVIFTACVDKGSKCGQTTPIVVRAQVNFEARKVVDPTPSLDLTRTWVQSWSVNR